MSVLTPDQANEILSRMTPPPPCCDLCQIEFTDTEPAHRTLMGPFPSWMCVSCLTRHEAMIERRMTPKGR
jgi:hypothetical protein